MEVGSRFLYLLKSKNNVTRYLSEILKSQQFFFLHQTLSWTRCTFSSQRNKNTVTPTNRRFCFPQRPFRYGNQCKKASAQKRSLDIDTNTLLLWRTHTEHCNLNLKSTKSRSNSLRRSDDNDLKWFWWVLMMNHDSPLILLVLAESSRWLPVNRATLVQSQAHPFASFKLLKFIEAMWWFRTRLKRSKF